MAMSNESFMNPTDADMGVVGVKGKRPPPGELVDVVIGKDKEGHDITVKQYHVMPEQAPIQPPQAPVDAWEAGLVKELEAAGWERHGYNQRNQILWRDPAGSNERGHIEVGARVPDEKDDAPVSRRRLKDVRQLHLPPIPWIYVTENAVKIKRAREAAAASGEASKGLLPSQRIDWLEARMKKQDLFIEQIMARIGRSADQQGSGGKGILGNSKVEARQLRAAIDKVMGEMQQKLEDAVAEDIRLATELAKGTTEAA